MSIQGDVIELQSINHEIKVLLARLRNLRKKAKDAEQRINSFLEQKGQPGVKFKGTAIIRETKPKRKPKKKADREADALYVLRKHGIDNPQNVLEELLEARRGSPEMHTRLKFKDIRK